MKKTFFSLSITALILFACNKSAEDTDAITLTASGTTIEAGQTITVTAGTAANTLAWSVNPAAAVTQTYRVTTEKTNYFTFSQPGSYTIGVRARNLQLDSIHHCNPAGSAADHIAESIWNHRTDSIWHHHKHHLGGCRKGQDSASIVIKVK